MKTQEIKDILGVYKISRAMAQQFNLLSKKHDANSIWLKGDYGIYVKGNIVAETKDLIVVC